jgi:type IV secretory pathway TrbD component
MAPGLNISPTEKTQELLGAAKDLALENGNTQVRVCLSCRFWMACAEGPG